MQNCATFTMKIIKQRIYLDVILLFHLQSFSKWFRHPIYGAFMVQRLNEMAKNIQSILSNGKNQKKKKLCRNSFSGNKMMNLL